MAKDVKINIVAKDKGSRVVKSFSDKTTSALKKIAGPLALGAVAAGFTKLLNDTVKLGDKFDKLNKKLGVSVETLSKLEHIANLNGVSFNVVTGSIERLQRRIGLATRGLGAAKKAFEELNIDVEALSKLSPEEQFLKLAEATLKIENPVKRAAIQFEIFGMTAAELQKMLPGLRKSLAETAASITTQQATDFAKFADNMTKFNKAVQTFQVSVFGEIVALLNDAADAAGGIERVAKAMGDTAGFVIKMMPGIGNMIQLLELYKTIKGFDTGAPGGATGGWKLDPGVKDIITDKPAGGGGVGAGAGSLGYQYKNTQTASDRAYYEVLNEERTFQGKIKIWQKTQQTKLEYNREEIINEDKKFEQYLELYAKKNKAMTDMEEEALEQMKSSFQKWTESAKTYEDIMTDIAITFIDTFANDFVDAILDADTSFKDFAKNFIREIAKMIAKTYVLIAVQKIAGLISGAVSPAAAPASGAASAAGAAVTTAAKGNVFAQGGIVNKPTLFPFAGGTGLMGEAGPEAILPLTRGSSGKLGVESNGGQQPQIVNYNIMAMDSKSFVDFVRQNPTAVTTVMNEQMQRGNSALNNNIRRVSR